MQPLVTHPARLQGMQLLHGTEPRCLLVHHVQQRPLLCRVPGCTTITHSLKTKIPKFFDLEHIFSQSPTSLLAVRLQSKVPGCLLIHLNLCTIQDKSLISHEYTVSEERPERLESSRQTKLNTHLRHQRLLRGWSLQQVADQLYKLGEAEDRLPGVTADMVGKWERGEKKPSPFYREKLCILYQTSADKLGLLEPQAAPECAADSEPVQPQMYPLLHLFSNLNVNSFPFAHTQPIDALLSGEQEGADILTSQLLSLSSRQLVMLTAIGWTPQEVIAALQVILQGETVMAKIHRRQLLQLGAGMVLGKLAFPNHEHPSVEERTQLSDAIGESIAASWTLFQNTNTAQMLAVGQAQLTLIQQAHHTLYPSVRPMHYSAAYRLIGAALHFQGRYDEARQAHEKSYIAALEGGDVWNMAQSLSWQADGLKTQRHYAAAQETIEGALRLLAQQERLESIRLRAHLLASGAENAAYLGDVKAVEAQLRASETLLKDLPAHEEFDHASWYQHAGTCALILTHYDDAISQLQQAMDALPPQWTLRHATTLMPLVLAYARKQEREASLVIAEKAIPVISAINSPSLNRQFVTYLHQELLGSFPTDPHIHAFVAETQQRLLPAKTTATAR